MRLLPSRLGDERGNALIEFVFIFCTALVLTIAASSRVELEIRSHSAAFAIANEALRTWQLTQDRLAASKAAGLTSETFGQTAANWQLNLEDQCGSRSRQTATAKVNEVVEVAIGFC